MDNYNIKKLTNKIYQQMETTDEPMLNLILEYIEKNNLEPEIIGKELLEDKAFIQLLGIDCEKHGILRPHLFGLESRLSTDNLELF